jgi:hypothetical protein
MPNTGPILGRRVVGQLAQRSQLDLRDAGAVRLEVLRSEAHARGDGFDRRQRHRAGDLQIIDVDDPVHGNSQAEAHA